MQDKDKRPYFVMANEYPRHRKIRGLSDKAFRLHVTLMALCNEELSDGSIAKHDFHQYGIKAAKELLATAPSSNPLAYLAADGTYRLHDYLKHQNAAVNVKQMMSERAEAGRRGGIISAHKRNHVDKKINDQNCALCNDQEPQHDAELAWK